MTPKIHISNMPPAVVDQHIEDIERAAYAEGWRAGAEATKAEINRELSTMLFTDKFSSWFLRWVDSLLPPEPPKEGER